MQPLPQDARRIAFFGGSFDPPHLGHLAVARAAMKALHLDAVLFAPVGAQPLKPGGASAGFDDRLEMTRLAVAADPGFAVSLADAPLPDRRPNYTLETLREMRVRLPAGGELFCLMGADSFRGLPGWHGAAEIPFVAPLIVAARPNEPLDRLAEGLPQGLSIEAEVDTCSKSRTPAPEAEISCYRIRNPRGDEAPFYVLPGVYVEISATAIRKRLRRSDARAGGGTRLVPDAVADYIRSHALYR